MREILHIGLTSSLGGIESYLLKIASQVDKEKYHFSFLVMGKNKPCFYKELKIMGCNFFFISSRRNSFLRSYVDLYKVLKRNNFDIIHCHFNSLSYIMPVIIGTFLGNRLIIHSRNAGSYSIFYRLFLHPINQCILHVFTHKNPNIVKIAVSDLAGEWMFGKHEIYNILTNGVDLDKYRFSCVKRKIFREKNRFLPEEIIFVNIASFRKQKNHLFLLKVFNELTKLEDNIKLILVGEGKLKKELLVAVKNMNLTSKVLFLGNQNNVSTILNGSDAFIFPSFYEGFPNALIEAEVSGLKCFASDTITKQVIIPEFCTQISLDLCAGDWANEIFLSMKSSMDRSYAYDLAQNYGLGVEIEVKKLTKLYENLLL